MTAEKTDLFAQVNRPKDPENMTDLEKKHLPVISAPESVKAGECFSVTIEVGKLLAHPNEHGHHIEFIDLYADEIYLCRADLTGVTTCPKICVCLNLTLPARELRAYASCNMHGIWQGVQAVEVRS